MEFYNTLKNQKIPPPPLFDIIHEKAYFVFSKIHFPHDIKKSNK